MDISTATATARSTPYATLSTPQRLAVGLAWLFVALLPFARSCEIPLLIMAALGVRLLIKQGKAVWWTGPARPFTLLFICLWLPAWLSLPDAVNLPKGLEMCLGALRFWLAGLFVIDTLRHREALALFLRLCAWTLAAWVVDGAIQAAFKRDVFGYGFLGGRLSGIFGGGSLRFGPMLAVLAPLMFLYGWGRWNKFALTALFGMTCVVLLLAGSRASWINFGVILLVWLATYGRRYFKPRHAVALVAMVVIAFGVSYKLFPEFSARLGQTSLLLQPDYHSVDTAVSGRLDIWGVSLRMAAAHPLNGIGVGGFRYAYERYALPGDPFVQPDHTGAFHPHQLILEALTEMGVFGLAGLIATYVLLIRLWMRADAGQRNAMLPYGLALLAIFFPINSHFATWSVSWGQVACFMLALYCAAFGTAATARDAAA